MFSKQEKVETLKTCHVIGDLLNVQVTCENMSLLWNRTVWTDHTVTSWKWGEEYAGISSLHHSLCVQVSSFSLGWLWLYEENRKLLCYKAIKLHDGGELFFYSAHWLKKRIQMWPQS